MIDDAEPAVHLAVRTQAPNLVQLEGWTHRFRDIDRHLRCKGYGEEAVSYYKACIGYLLSANSKLVVLWGLLNDLFNHPISPVMLCLFSKKLFIAHSYNLCCILVFLNDFKHLGLFCTHNAI